GAQALYGITGELIRIEDLETCIKGIDAIKTLTSEDSVMCTW
ncbi:18957_t:CDS:1, partial [Funneliformis geosporum]